VGLVQQGSEEHARKIENPNLKFIGYGSIGAAFLAEYRGQRAVIKVALALEGNDEAQTIKRDRVEIEMIRRNSIINIEAETGKPIYGPEIDFMPALVYDESGNHLGTDDVLITKFYDGAKILDQDPDDDKLKLCHREYIERGIDDSFLDQFIEAYVRHAGKGSDLFDLAVHNSLYKDGRLQFFETTGFDDHDTHEVNEFREQYSVAALLKALLTDVVLFETFHSSENKDAVERSVIKYDFNRGDVKQYWNNRYEQVERGLGRAIDSGVFTEEQLLQGIREIRLNTASNSSLMRWNNLFSDEGLEHLARLERSKLLS